MADRTGQQLGNYRLVRLLGRGGFAEVYLGEHLRLKTQAAIKVLYTALGEDDIEGFLREAQTVARLKHPHIVRVFDFDVQDHTSYLVMDYLPNGSIRRLYPKGTALPLAAIVASVTQIASALQYAHDEKVIHRDVKPENMLLDRDNTLVLSDFGIALMAQSSHYQSAQEIAGTAAYMAPEQFQGHPHRASDQYALGVVVYEWLSGARPFHGTFSEIASQHMFVPPPILRDRIPTISPEVEQVVLTALAKDPKQRFSSVLAFSTALEQASQVIQPEPIVPVSETIGSNQSQQPTKLATTVPALPLSQQIVSEVSADLADPAAQPRKFIPSSAKDSLPQAEKGRRQAEGERTRQKQEQADNIEEKQVRKEKEAKAAQKAEKEKVHKAEETLIPTDKQEPTPSHLPPAAVPKIPKGLRLRSWKVATLLLVLALLILGSGVGLYATVSLSSERTQATTTATTQANSTVTATAITQANSTATAQTQAHATITAQASIPRKIWHIEHAGTSGFLNGVAWSGSQFVAVGTAGTILISRDGHTWAAQQSGTSAGLSGVTWSGSQFVVVGDNGTILTSP